MRSSLASLKGQHYQVHTCRPARLQCTLHPERQARRFPTVRSPRTEISFQSIAFLADRKNVECHRFFSNLAHGWIYEKKKKKIATWRNLMRIEIFRDTKNSSNRSFIKNDRIISFTLFKYDFRFILINVSKKKISIFALKHYFLRSYIN